jgi:hypothetical protein
MACPKFLRTDLNPTGQSGGQWTYVGYNSSVPGPPWSDTPSIPLVNVAINTVYTPGNDNPTINPLGVSTGFYAFDYVVNAPVSGGNACSDTKRIVIQIAPAACAGQTRSISLCGDSAVLNLVDELEVGSACEVAIGTPTGTAIANPGYTGSPSYTFDPSLSTAGTFNFTNTLNVTPYSGYTLDCDDCDESSATLSLTVTPVEANGSASEAVCVGFSETLNMYALSGSAVSNGSWYYWSGPNLSQTLSWNGGTINAATPGQLLSVGASAPLVTGNLAAGNHVFRYVTSVAPCYRYRDVTIEVGAVPSAGVFLNPAPTICGGATCAPLVLNSIVQFETPDGTFALTTTFTGNLYVSISEATPVLFNNLNPLNGLAYGATFRVTTFPGSDPISVNTIIYTVVNGACEASSQGTFVIQPPNTGMSVTSPQITGCITTPQFLLRNNFTNFRSGGYFRIRYRSNLAFGYTTYTGAAFINQFVGSPPPPNAVHSLTAAFNPAVAASGWYEVTYTREADGGLAALCSECQTQSWTYVFRLNGNSCGCFEPCDVQPGAIPSVTVCAPYSDGCSANTFTAFTVFDAIDCATGLTNSCPVQPQLNFWRTYITQGPANPTLNGAPVGQAYPFQAPTTINWSTSTPGTYRFSYQPQVNQTGGGAYDQDECFTAWEADFVVCAPAPCVVNITSLTYGAGTITSSVSGCSGTVTYAWTGPSGFTATTANITPNRIGTYTLTATCPDGSTCTSQASITLTCTDLGLSVAPSTNDITASLTGPCAAPVVYTWTRPNGGGSSTGATITPNNGNGVYSVTSSCNGVATGCTATYTCGITVNIVNNGAQLIGSASGCGAVGANYVYAWTGPGGFTASTATITPSTTGTYTLTVTCVDSGCVASASQAFSVTCNLSVSIAASGANLVATGSGTCTGGTYNYSWNAQPSNVTTIGSSVAYVAGQTYTVTLTCVGGANASCPAATAVFSCPSFTVNIA